MNRSSAPTRKRSGDSHRREKASKVSRSKTRFFTGFMLLLPILFFLLLEGILRLSGYGEDYPLFVPVPGYSEYQVQNRDVARRYFHRSVRVPTGISDVFKTEKDSLTIRIFVQGGSSAAGYPYYYGGSFSRMLELRLQQTFLERNVEVVNTSLAAVNSYTMLDFADEIIAQQPDAVLMYAGHNEFYGALGIGSSESLGRFPGLIRLYLRLRPLRTVQAIRSVLSWTVGFLSSQPDSTHPGKTLMERMVGKQEIPFRSKIYEAGIEQFRSNLSLLLARYRDHGIPVFIATVTSNEAGQKPFISRTGDPTLQDAYDKATDHARSLASADSVTHAISTLSEAIALDSIGADAWYLRGSLNADSGAFDAARNDFEAARDRDELRFRAPSDINRVIRETAAATGAHLVDVEGVFAEASPHGIVDNTLILEHLHPNLDGYFLIADSFFEALRAAGMFDQTWIDPMSAAEARYNILATAVDSLYGTFRVQQLMGSWPFQPPGSFDRSLETMTSDDPVVQITLDLYRGKTKWYDATDALRRLYLKDGKLRKAFLASLAMVQQFPFLGAPYAYAGEIMARQDQYIQAIAYFETALEFDETVPVLLSLGRLKFLLGENVEAGKHFERAHRLAPDNLDASAFLATYYTTIGQTDRARTLLEEVLEVNPDHRLARDLYGRIKAAEGS